MRVLVFGGRDYRHRKRVFAILDAEHAKIPFTVVIHGDARGADRLAKAWARSRGVLHIPYKALWDVLDAPNVVIRYHPSGYAYNVAAGSQRNQRMLDNGKPDKAIGFPGGKGSADMAKRCRKVGIEPMLITD